MGGLMGRDYSVIQTNVGNNIQDTSSATASILGVYINRRYLNVLRQINWNYINEDYTVSVTAGTQDYVLASDFGHELYCEDATNKRAIARTDLQAISQEFPGKMTTSGTVYRYAIFNSDDGNKYIRFHYNPSTNMTVNLPYVAKPSALSNATDEPVLGLEDLIEVGATADALRYKRRYAQAKEWEVQYRLMLDDFIWEQYNQPNMVYQFKPNTFNRDDLV